MTPDDLYKAGVLTMDVEVVKSLLHENRFRMTQEREAVLTSFIHAEKLVTPGQLHLQVVDEGVQVGLTTVYRLLEVLTKLGLSTPFLLDGEVYYAFCTGQHHHHFICTDCKRVRDVFECPSFDLSSDYGTVVNHKLDLFGHCSTCEAVRRGEVGHSC